MAVEKFIQFLKSSCSDITIEPIITLFTLVISMSGISSQELYLKKACVVNFNHSIDLCENIYSHKDAQLEVQKHISGVQV